MSKKTEFGNNTEIKHEQLVQRDALLFFKDQYKDHNLETCGLFIDEELPYLCASPLRLYGNDHIISIKCPLKQYEKLFDEVIDQIPFWKKEGGAMLIDRKSDWYIELQIYFGIRIGTKIMTCSVHQITSEIAHY